MRTLMLLALMAPSVLHAQSLSESEVDVVILAVVLQTECGYTISPGGYQTVQTVLKRAFGERYEYEFTVRAALGKAVYDKSSRSDRAAACRAARMIAGPLL